MERNETSHKIEKFDLKVLYAEDEDYIRDSFTRIMTRKVKSVVSAANGKLGLEEFEREKPDIIITDIKMPVMDGLSFAKRIKEISPETPVVITTAFTDIEHFIKAIEIGVDRFLVKPIDTDKLTAVLSEYCELIQNQNELVKNRKLLEEYKKAVDASAIVSKTDREGRIIYVNDAFCKISGFERDDIIGKTHSLIRHPNMRKELFDEMWSTINAKNIWHGILENKKRDGSSYFVDMKIVPIMDEHDEIIEFIDIQNDITELIKKEQELEGLRMEQMKENIDKASDIKLESLLKSIPLPSIIIDENDTVLFANKRFERLFDIYNDNETLDELNEKRLNFRSLFIIDDNATQTILDWKDLALDMGDEAPFFVKIKSDNIEKSYHVSVEKPQTISPQKRFVVCLDECVKN